MMPEVAAETVQILLQLQVLFTVQGVEVVVRTMNSMVKVRVSMEQMALTVRSSFGGGIKD
jgi:hypothetical protein